MFAVFLAAAIAGQLPTPQSAPPIERAAPAATAPVYLLMAPAPQAAPAAPSVVVSKPPIWDRALASTGAWLTARAAKHQHPTAVTAILVTPAVATTPPPASPVFPNPVPIQLGAPPRPSAQISAAEAAPPPPFASPSAPPVLLSVDDLKRLLERRGD